MKSIGEAVEAYQNDKFDEAEKIALDILKVDECSEEAIDVLSAIYLKTGQLDFVEGAKKDSLSIIRKIAVYLYNLQMYEQSMFFYKKSLSLDPNDCVGLNNLGLIFECLDDYKNAQIAYEKSLKVMPNYHAYYNLGVIYRMHKEVQKSIQYLKKALSYKPQEAEVNYSLGMSYLMGRNFDEGYRYFLKRKTKGKEQLKNLWDGEKHQDKTVLVFCDYGFGDAIMFSRYFPFLNSCFSKVKVFIRSPLLKLFENSFENLEFFTNMQGIEYDYSVLAMDLPYFLKMDFSNIPYHEGYLKADEQKCNEYNEKYFKTDKLKVGIVAFSGDKAKRNARKRSIGFEMLQKLSGIQNVKLYSFQKKDEFCPCVPCEYVDLGSTFSDFSDTAAALKNLDVLVSVDTSVLHLAGALGVKSYLMLPYNSEWRWFDAKNPTPWYKSVKMFSQKTFDDWQSVVDEIYEELKS